GVAIGCGVAACDGDHAGGTPEEHQTRQREARMNENHSQDDRVGIVPMPTRDRLEPRATMATVSDACVHYGPLVALAPVTFDIGRGETIALVGSNGSGKTTLLTLLAGLTEPTDGTVAVEGQVAMVTQQRE